MGMALSLCKQCKKRAARKDRFTGSSFPIHKGIVEFKNAQLKSYERIEELEKTIERYKFFPPHCPECACKDAAQKGDRSTKQRNESECQTFGRILWNAVKGVSTSYSVVKNFCDLGDKLGFLIYVISIWILF